MVRPIACCGLEEHFVRGRSGAVDGARAEAGGDAEGSVAYVFCMSMWWRVVEHIKEWPVDKVEEVVEVQVGGGTNKVTQLGGNKKMEF